MEPVPCLYISWSVFKRTAFVLHLFGDWIHFLEYPFQVLYWMYILYSIFSFSGSVSEFTNFVIYLFQGPILWPIYIKVSNWKYPLPRLPISWSSPTFSAVLLSTFVYEAYIFLPTFVLRVVVCTHILAYLRFGFCMCPYSHPPFLGPVPGPNVPIGSPTFFRVCRWTWMATSVLRRLGSSCSMLCSLIAFVLWQHGRTLGYYEATNTHWQL